MKIPTKFRCVLQNYYQDQNSDQPYSGSEFYIDAQYQNYILCTEDTHPIFLGSANSFKSYCVHGRSIRDHRYADGQTDRQAKIKKCLFWVLGHTKHVYTSIQILLALRTHSHWQWVPNTTNQESQEWLESSILLTITAHYCWMTGMSSHVAPRLTSDRDLPYTHWLQIPKFCFPRI